MATERILVVDDEIVIRALLSDILASEGYEVETAGCGKEALELLRGPDNFAVLFTDVMMPEMDGLTLIHEARRLRPSLIPIVMTGFATLDSARASVKEGAYDYVLKPFSLSEVKLAVSNALERCRLENENARLREVSRLFDISEAIATIRDERELLDFVLRAALERVGAASGSIVLTMPDSRALEWAVSVGEPDEAACAMPPAVERIADWVAANAQPLLVADIAKHSEFADIGNAGYTSFVSVPLVRKHAPGGESIRGGFDEQPVLAVLTVSGKSSGDRFSEGDLKILSIVANHAAAALDNARLINEIEDAHLATLQSMALLLEAKDPYTHGHSERVRSYSVLAARKLGMSQQDIDVLRLGAALHDIGKVGVKDALLNKSGPPTPEEWEMVKRHPVVGYEVLLPVRLLTKDHLCLVRGHHERIDGSGYPDGLQGDQVPDVVRVIAVADAYDAMASDRAYRPALSASTIIEQLLRYAGSQFDDRVARLFVEMIRNGELQWRSDMDRQFAC